ncbi:MAG: SIMPL domain-containing protein [Alphaproteobacteria bacterium]|nr:SIMPL domain-containing protein [Alphaproteobacteria bacterium]
MLRYYCWYSCNRISRDITNLLDINTQDHINKCFLKQQGDVDKVIKSLVASGINMSSITYSKSLGDWSKGKTIDSTIVVRTKNLKFLDTLDLPISNASVSRFDYDYSDSEKLIESLEERATDDAQHI